jgi:PKD domain
VTNSARYSSQPSGRRRSALRATLLALGLSIALLAALATSAQALVTTVGSVTVGVQPRAEGYPSEGSRPTYANPSGNPVLHGEGVYAIYWDPTDHYWSEWQNVIDEYLHNAGATSGSLASVFSVDSQYTDKSNKVASYAQTFKGAYTDAHAYPVSGCSDPDPFEAVDQIEREFGGPVGPICLTSEQVAVELESFITRQGLPKGLGNVYYLLTPPGVTVCLDGGGAKGHCSDYEKPGESYDNSFCSYHGAINPGGLPTGDANTLVYGVIPWTAGTYGDSKLVNGPDLRPGWACQDGGVNPAGKKGYELEKEKTRDKKEQEEFEEKNPEEQAEIEEVKHLEGPHEQEPNQKACPNTNGACDYGLSDPIINQISLEQQNIVTDPLLNAWMDTKKFENTDECRFLFGPVLGGSVTASSETRAGTLYDQTYNGGNYYLNDAFSLSAERLPNPGVGCINQINLDPKFTAPNTVNAGESAGFNGMESDITLDADIGYSATGTPQPNYATYSWNFGDGSPVVGGYAPGAPACEVPWLSPCAASIFHSYQYGGTYTVTLTVTDTGGNVASTSHEVTVDGPPAPTASTTTTTTGSAAEAAAAAAAAALAAANPPVPAPVAADAVLSRKLRSLGKSGLLVRYSVNEQVAGHFEVLLGAALAKRLGISGTPAVGLPTGTPPELVIAKAVVVTTAGGRNSVKLYFSKKTAQRLSRQHKVPFMLRLIVRNAAAHTPTTTTVLSAFTLTR